MTIKEREKLSDVLAKSRSSRPSARAAFEEAFPNIRSISVKVSESDGGPAPETLRESMTVDSFRPAVDCSNPLCHGGGVQLDILVHQMVFKHKTHLETGKMCAGKEGSPKGKVTYRSCYNSFGVVIDIDYVDQQAAEDTDTGSEE